MTKIISRWLVVVAITVVTNNAAADTGVIDMWKTEPVDGIGYLYIKIEPCDEHLCGTITFAFGPTDEPNPGYEHIGKKMVWGMGSKFESSWGGGKIWDPRGTKVYNSKMVLNGDVLNVSGCFLLFCSGQKWARVKQ